MKDKSIENKIKNFYENNPYPGLGEKLMMQSAHLLSPFFNKPGNVLFPGCGTGHGIVAMAKLRPDLKCYGIDLSKPSLDIAKKLAEKYQVDITLKQGNYMEPLPFDIKFDFITLQGTLHHTSNPSEALKNVIFYLNDDGLIHINLYGKKYHYRRFEIIEILDLLQKEHNLDIKERFDLFDAMQKYLKHKNIKDYLLDFSPRYVWHLLRGTYNYYRSKLSNFAVSVPWHADFKECNQLWIDQYCNPNEFTYDIWETKELIESANLEVVEMLSLGKVNRNDLPELWYNKFEKLSKWDQYRIMELYYPKTYSVNLIAKKVKCSL